MSMAGIVPDALLTDVVFVEDIPPLGIPPPGPPPISAGGPPAPAPLEVVVDEVFEELLLLTWVTASTSRMDRDIPSMACN